MEKGKYSYNPERDLQPVEKVGFIDLAKANAAGAVPASIDAEQLVYNEIDDPNSIGYRPKDVFEQMQANKQIVGYKPKSKSTSDTPAE